MPKKVTVVFTLIALWLIGSAKATGQIWSAQAQAATGPPAWGYLEDLLPPNWAPTYTDCGGSAQSPINIVSRLTTYDSSLTPITIQRSQSVGPGAEDTSSWGDTSAPETWDILNTGDSVKLTPASKTFKMTLSPEGATYRFLQMHFHWRGSEHTVDGYHYAAELHLVHQKVTNNTQLAVIGFFIALAEDDNSNLQPLINQIASVTTFNTSANAVALTLSTMIPFTVSNYYRYSGSLTNPTCDERVTWTVVDSPILTMSEKQLVQLQTLKNANGNRLLTNSRPVQPLNNRVVSSSFKKYTLGSVSWIFQGTALQNNSVLTFNKDDTLNLACKFTQIAQGNSFSFYIHKGSAPSTIKGTRDSTTGFATVTVSGTGTLVYSDYDGVKSGFENVAVVPLEPGQYGASRYRNIGIGLLHPKDAGTYHCSVYEYLVNRAQPIDIDATGAVASSGGVTIVVNTKPGQARSSQTQSSRLMTYSALILGASKLLF